MSRDSLSKIMENSATIEDNRESSNLLVPEQAEVETYKLYPKRWSVLAIYVCIITSNNIQTPEYVSVTDTITKYYDCSIEYISWSSMINSVVGVIIIFPSIFFIEKVGLRNSVVISAIGTAIGAWINVAGVAPDKFWIVIFGEAVNSVFQTILIIIPPKLAAVWFGTKEISTACSIAITASSIGSAFGYLIPTLVLTSTEFFDIENGLYLINIVLALVTSSLIPISFFYFSERPPTPPTRAQTEIENLRISVQSFKQSMKALLTNSSFLFVIVVFMLNCAVYNAFTTLLNPIIIKHYPNATEEVGIIGLLMYSLGGLGLIITGILLDRFCQYKVLMWVITLALLVTSALLLFLISYGMNYVYIFTGLYGFLFNAYLVMCIQLGVELTYPESENNVAGIQAIAGQSFSLILTYSYSFFINSCSELVMNLIFIGIIVFGDIFLLFVKFNLKRQSVLKVN